MSEQVPEQRPGGGGNVLTRRAGPLPVWGWLLGITVAGVAYYLLKSRSSSGASATTGTTGAAGIPDYVSQTTINLAEPPEAPPVTPPPGGGKKPPGKKPVRPGNRKTPQPPVMSNSYTVKPGDTLDKLAERFGVSRVELAHANGLGTGAGLRTGQEIKVPGPVRPRSEGGPG